MASSRKMVSRLATIRGCSWEDEGAPETISDSAGLAEDFLRGGKGLVYQGGAGIVSRGSCLSLLFWGISVDVFRDLCDLRLWVCRFTSESETQKAPRTSGESPEESRLAETEGNSGT